ncbi:MAG: tetratricopeptide repeat protein, partial [Candidatus Omnitrophota bacterium]
MSKNHIILTSIILIITCGFLVYANSLSGEFIRDDNALIRDNPYIRSTQGVLKYFRNNIAMGSGQQWNSYRPLQMVTYYLDYYLWKLNAKGYRLTNIFLHILVALSIYWLITILFRDQLLSLLCSIFFVIHPIHTQAISYISGRADSLALLFMLLCFIFYIRYLRTKNVILYVLIVLTYVLALFSRENSLILPALLLLYHFTFKKKLKSKAYPSILLVSFIYILLRLTVLRSLLFNISYSTTLLERVPGFFVAITNYTRLMLFPFNLHAGYGRGVFSLSEPRAILGMVISFCLLTYAFRKRNTNNLVFFAIYWFFIGLLPQSNLYPINAYMAEHWLYLPSIGFFLILAKGISYLYKTKQFKIIALVFIIILSGFYAYLTTRQNRYYWREPIAFYKRNLEYAPNNFMEYNNLGLAYYQIGKIPEAITAYKQAIEIKPDFVQAYNNLASAYEDIGKREEAIALLKQAIEIMPEFVKAYYNLGAIYSAHGKNQEAIAAYKQAIKIKPDFAEAYYNLGLIYYAINKNEEAIDAYKQAIKADPRYAEAYNNLGLAYHNIGRNQAAIDSLKKAIKINSNYAQAYNNLGAICSAHGQNQEAITAYKQAIKIKPDLPEAHNNL